MKKLLIAVALFTALSAQAQYWQSVYYSQDYDVLTSGQNTFLIGNGHVMSGFNRGVSSASADLLVVKTDEDGLFSTTNDFKNIYELYDPATGAALFTTHSDVLEIDPALSGNNAQYVVTGSCFYSAAGAVTRHYVFYLELKSDGTVIPGSGLLLYAGGSFSAPDFITASSSVLSATGQDVYLTGHTIATGGSDAYAWVAKINFSGAPTVVMTYVFSMPNGTSPEYSYPKDLIESPYNSSDLIIVGQSYNGTDYDGFFQIVDANNGGVTSAASFFGSVGSNEEFTSIIVSNNSTVNPSIGFAVGGYTDYNLSTGVDAWLAFFNTTGGFLGDKLFNYVSGDYHYSYDMKERKNTLGDWEYYAVGDYYDPSFVPEMMVLKYNFNNGNVDAFLYGGSKNEMGRAIDYYEGVGPDGITAYGFTNNSFITGTSSDFYVVKAYFNGVSGCNELLSTGNPYAAPGQITTSGSMDMAFLSDVGLKYADINDMKDKNLCYNTTIGGGSNAMNGKLPATDPHAANQVNNTGITLQALNPVSAQETLPVQINLNKQVPAATASIAVYDLQGRRFELGTHVLVRGSNQLQLELPALELNNGVYLLEVQTETEKVSTLLYVR